VKCRLHFLFSEPGHSGILVTAMGLGKVLGFDSPSVDVILKAADAPTASVFFIL